MSDLKGWYQGELGKLCSIKIGGTPSRNISEYWDTEKSTNNLWVSIKDLNQKVVISTLEHITNLGVRKSNVKLQETGTILLSFKLTIGRVSVAGKPLYTNEAIAGIKSNILNTEFLYHGLQQWDLLQDVDQAIKGATLNKEKLKKIKFQYPESIKEQIKIAEMLSTVDKAISETEALIAKQQRIKTGLMQDLLTRGIDEDGNLRSEETHRFKDSPLGRIPIEWNITSISKIATDITSGSRWWAKYYSEEGAIFIRIGNLTREHINLRLDSIQYVASPESAEKNRTLVKEGDLLISVTADLGIIGVIKEEIPEAYINQHIALIRLNKTINPRFVGHYLASLKGKEQFDHFNESGAKAGLNLPTVGKLCITKPSIKEQIQISKLLDLIDYKILESKFNLQKLQRLKTGLMQDLLTGKKRVTSLLENSPIP